MKKLYLLLCLFSLSAYIGEGMAEARTCAVANGDAQRVTDAHTTVSSGVVTSATGLFVVGDVGKTVILVSSAGANRLSVNTTTITSYQSATQVTLTANANATDTSVTMVWGTGDSTSAITTQVTACKAPAASTYPNAGGIFAGTSAGQVTLSGGYIVSGCIYDVLKTGNNGPLPGFVGSGRYNTVLFLTPTITACADPAILFYAAGQGLTLQGVAIEANNVAQSSTNNLLSISSSEAIITDFELRNYGNSQVGAPGAALSATLQYSEMSQVIVQGAPGAALNFQCNFQMSAAVMRDVFCSNGFRNVNITSGSSRTPSTVGATWIGGGADECGDPLQHCMIVTANSELQASGITIFGVLEVDPGAAVYITNSNVGAFNNSNALTGAYISAGATVYSTGTTWRGNAGSKAVVNAGTFVDELGNNYATCTVGSCTARRAGQAFTGNLPITR
jgi:hypothetical protein